MAVLTSEGQALTIGTVDPDPGPRLPTPRHWPLSHPLPSATTPQGQGRPCLQDCLFPIGRCVLLVFVAEASDENHEAPPQVEVGFVKGPPKCSSALKLCAICRPLDELQDNLKAMSFQGLAAIDHEDCLLYTSPSPRDRG